jgi:hypothetical protein
MTSAWSVNRLIAVLARESGETRASTASISNRAKSLLGLLPSYLMR